MLRFAIPLLAVLLPATALARPIVVEFEAVVRDVADDFGMLPGVEIGSVVQGSYLFDDEVLPEESGPFGRSAAIFTFSGIKDAGFEFSVEKNEFKFRNKSDPEIPLEIIDRRSVFPQGDMYAVQWAESSQGRRVLPFAPGVARNFVSLALFGPGLLGDLVASPPVLGDARSTLFEYVSRRDTCPPTALCPTEIPIDSRFAADLKSIRVVPEPVALLLLTVALAALQGVRGCAQFMGRRGGRALLIVLLAVGPSSGAQARSITVEFEAVVSQVVDHFGLLPYLEVGSIVTGSYLYDDTFPNSSKADSIGHFESAGFKMAGFEFEVGGEHFVLRNDADPDTPLEILAFDAITRPGPTIDEYWVRWVEQRGQILRQGIFCDLCTTLNSVNLSVRGSSLFAGPFGAVPGPPSLERSNGSFQFIAAEEARGPAAIRSALYGELTTLRVVPEPSTGVLLGFAVAGLLALRRRTWNSRARRCRSVLVLLGLAASTAAEGRPITVAFEAVVTEVADDFELIPDVRVGSTVVGSYTYDDELLVIERERASIVFRFPKFDAAGFEFAVGGQHFELRDAEGPGAPMSINVWDAELTSGPFDAYTVHRSTTGGDSPPSEEDPISQIGSINLSLIGGQHFDGVGDSPPLPPSVEESDAALFQFVARREIPLCVPRAECPQSLIRHSWFRARLSSVRVAPEPSTCTLLGVATAGLLAARRRRRRASSSALTPLHRLLPS